MVDEPETPTRIIQSNSNITVTGLVLLTLYSYSCQFTHLDSYKVDSPPRTTVRYAMTSAAQAAVLHVAA